MLTGSSSLGEGLCPQAPPPLPRGLRAGGGGAHRCGAVHLVPAAEDKAGLPVVHPAKHRV